jgi:hypothetical protein
LLLKDILKSLINSLLPKEEKIFKLELKNPYNLADYIAGKLSIIDIKAVDEKGKEEGEKIGIEKAALNMINHGMSIDDVVKITGLNSDDIKGIMETDANDD